MHDHLHTSSGSKATFTVLELIQGVLLEPDPQRKLAAARTLLGRCATNENCAPDTANTVAGGAPSPCTFSAPTATGVRPLPYDLSATSHLRNQLPIRPARPHQFEIVTAVEMPRRKRPGDPEGAAALLHALAQIELAAIEIDVAQLALYPLAPAQWHADMASIILDECQHFDSLCGVLESWDKPFGFWPVHHTLWDGFLAGKTWLEHLVLTTRFQEASGVDASHELIAIARSVRSGRRLPQILGLLEQLHEDEIRHVAIGSKWWNFALDHNAVWPSLAERDAAACEHYFAVVESRVRNPWSRRFPFYLEGRARAGFNPFELAAFGSLQPTANPRPPLEQTAKGSV